MRRLVFLPILLALVVAGFVSASSADAAGSVGWAPLVVSEPSSFRPADAVACEGVEKKCDRYQLLVRNAGDQESEKGQPVRLTDVLPAGITTLEVKSGSVPNGGEWSCPGDGPGSTTVTCELQEPNGGVAGGRYAPYLQIIVGAPAAGASGVLTNHVTVEGGGASAQASVTDETPIDSPASFSVNEFAFEPQTAGGARALAAGGHPSQLTTDVGIPSGDSPPHGVEGEEGLFAPARNMRSVSVELPDGLLGLPLATERCEEYALRLHSCPVKSRVGIVALLDGKTSEGEFAFTEDKHGTESVGFVYNMVPEGGYPAEFGFVFANAAAPVLLYANVLHTGSGYRVRVTAPGVPSTLETLDVSLTFFGEPGQLNGSGSTAAFLSSPSDCTAESEGLSGAVKGTAKAFASRLELEPWGELGHVVSGEDTVYPQLSGCGALHFNPSLSLAPSPAGSDPATEEGTTLADAPSAYSVDLTSPQTTNYSELATPPVRTATVTLPAGVSVSPSAANGLGTCQATGPEGINVGSNDIGVHGQDLGDPEATELGEGHEGGNNSPYDDGFYHTAPGHCPSSSSLGTVEVSTPLLESPLHGHIYLAAPKCGGEGQPECTEASATNGELFAGYIEVAGSGVIIKIPGTIAANPRTGQLTGTFTEAPQFPFSDFKLHFHGGPRAPIANPQTCGGFTTTSNLEPWSHDRANPVEGTPDALTSNTFEIGGCAASMPFAPTFSAGTTGSAAGRYSPFVLSFSRQDREQDLSGLSETMPAGLLGKLAGVPQCGEAQANAGTCSGESLLGSVTATAGPGSEPFTITGGRVYLTGPYGGGPFGLSVVVPAKAGPFNLGNVVVRASIRINPETSQVTVTTDALPQIKDGVPFRLRTINTEINRPGFTFNPTNCNLQAVTGTISAFQGASANVSSPVQSTGCTGLAPFKPSFTVSTQSNTSKADGASLDVRISAKQGPGQPAGSEEANIRKIDTQLPTNLPSRLSTLQKACTEKQFAANPAGCPEGSFVGAAVAHTPVLPVPLEGPAILVSHGGAAFPDLDLLLQGDGVTIDLVGNTDIKNGITYSKFETAPDAPFESFELRLPEGPHSILGSYIPNNSAGSFCGFTKTVTVSKKETKTVHGKKKKVTVKVKTTIAASLEMPTTITAQDGAVESQDTKIAVSGCPKPKPAAKTTKAKKSTAPKKTTKRAGKR
jgi:hypothetical protein